MVNQGNTLLGMLPGNVTGGGAKLISPSSGNSEGLSSGNRFENVLSGVLHSSVNSVSEETATEKYYNSTGSAILVNRALIGNSNFNLAELATISECSSNTQNTEQAMVESIEELIALSENNVGNNSAVNQADLNGLIPENLSTFGIYNSLKTNQQNLSDNINLEPGNYKIVDSSINNGELSLTLQSAGDSSKKIQVTLPVDQLKESIQTGSGKANNAYRVPLDGQNRETAEMTGLEDYFSKLNLKELDISYVNNTLSNQSKVSSNAQQETAQLTITAENTGEKMAIKANLEKKQLQLSKSGERSGRLVTNQNTVKSTGNPVSSEPVSLNQSADVVQKGNQFNPEKNLAGDLLKEVPMQEQTFNEKLDIFGLNRINDNGNSTAQTGQKVEGRNVRFTFPDNFNTSLKPNGQSITLKIEPEYLGSARVNLVLHNNVLTARVIVTNAHAKAALESNLDALVKQLSDSDINVNSIEVSVGGQGSESTPFEKQTIWPNRSRAVIYDINEKELEDEGVSATSDVYLSPRMYVGVEGVNLLA